MNLEIQIDPNSEYKEFFHRAIRGTEYTINDTTDFFNDNTVDGKEGISNIQDSGKFDGARQFLATMLHVLLDGPSLAWMKAIAHRSYLEFREGNNVLSEIFVFRACAGGGVIAQMTDATTAADTTVARSNFTNGEARNDNGYQFKKPILCLPTKSYELKHRFAPIEGSGTAPKAVVNAGNASESEFAVHLCGYLGRHTN